MKLRQNKNKWNKHKYLHEGRPTKIYNSLSNIMVNDPINYFSFQPKKVTTEVCVSQY